MISDSVSDTTYLDYNATAPVKPEVASRVAELIGAVGNPSSVHRYGQEARRVVEAARHPIAGLVGGAPKNLIFTASGTEANNLALTGFPGRRILVSAIEHDSVLRRGDAGSVIPVTPEGVIDLAAADRLLSSDPRPALVSVMLANNETGVIQPIRELAEIAHRHGALLHSDAVQCPGRIAIDMNVLGIDLVTLSAHKIGGTLGAGCLILRANLEIAPLLLGGAQESGRRAGTENVPAIGGFGRAAELAYGDLDAASRVAALRDGIETVLKTRVPALEVHGAGVPRLPNTSCFGLDGYKAETQLMALDLAGIAVSAGSACSSGKMHPSHVLLAMGVPANRAGCAIRISLGAATTPVETTRLVDGWASLATRRSQGEAA